ncbi:transcriptional repressor [Patescibacteria group bacterium]|nr:transcriptional repressor [Patescibacteria group bacterium]MBU4579779.1 transcriptional repressor [Patescibacteria group bacterium]
MNLDTVFQNIHSKGGRITKIRKEIARTLFEKNCLMSQADILTVLKKRQICPNRSTIFRELFFFAKNNIIIKNTILDIDYYEIPQDHHHHLVCLSCNSIIKVEIGSHLVKQEKQIAKQNKFNIINHSLEFYGICKFCQNLD